MSDQDKKQKTSTSFLLPAGALIIAIFGMLMVSVGIIALTGIFFGNNQSFQAKTDLKKGNSPIVVISYSKTVEDEIRKKSLDTPALPLQSAYSTQHSLLNFSYRY